MTQPLTFIFAGRSGCGKGTQLKLLKKYLSEVDPNHPQFDFATGDGFRKLFEGQTLTAELSKKITHQGKLQPLFLTIWLWANEFVKNLTPEQHLFIDGYPRRFAESEAVDSALKFYNRAKPIVLNFIVSRESSRARMLSRGRADDTPELAEERLNWYDEKVTPAIDFFRNNEDYIFLDINGEQTIEAIHQDIINRLTEITNGGK